MAFCELKYHSPALGKATAANVILPEGHGRGPFATLYLLHGLSDDHTIWHRRTSIERYVAPYPLIVVMPDGGRGFYCDAKEGAAWETSLICDLIPMIDTLFRTRATREARCIGGLSMGGYGAAKLALKYPDLFCSAVSHSGALGFAHKPFRDEDPRTPEFRRIVGNDPAGGPDDLFALASRLLPAQRPAIRIDCGLDDVLLPDNRAFHAHLKSIGFPHEYEEFPGAHEWAYWDVHVQEAIAFHARHLGIKPRRPPKPPQSARRG
jgi:S-formylglutathione hydrolase FrmB